MVNARSLLNSIVFLILVPSLSLAAPVISVPEDYPTIQEAIDAATPISTIRVMPGVYEESLTMREGIYIRGSGVDNTFLVAPSGPAVLADGVVDTSIGGFNISSPDTYPIMIQNGADMDVIDNNFEGTTFGIQFHDSKGRVSGNIFMDLDSEDSIAVSCMNGSSPTIIGNLFVRSGTAVLAYNDSHPMILNNTMVGGTYGIDFRAAEEISTSLPVITNNIITEFNTAVRALNGATPESMAYNLLYANGFNYKDVPLPPTDRQTDPEFMNADGDDYRLLTGSPAIDTGGALPYGEAYASLVKDGNGDGIAIRDIGAFEFGTSMDRPYAGSEGFDDTPAGIDEQPEDPAGEGGNEERPEGGNESAPEGTDGQDRSDAEDTMDGDGPEGVVNNDDMAGDLEGESFGGAEGETGGCQAAPISGWFIGMFLGIWFLRRKGSRYV